MRQIAIPDGLYAQAERRAATQGVSVSAYIVDVLSEALRPDPNDMSHIFTPEVLVELDAALAEAKAGKSYTREQVDEFLMENRKAWLEKRAR